MSFKGIRLNLGILVNLVCSLVFLIIATQIVPQLSTFQLRLKLFVLLESTILNALVIARRQVILNPRGERFVSLSGFCGLDTGPCLVHV